MERMGRMGRGGKCSVFTVNYLLCLNMPKSSKPKSTPEPDWNYEETVAQVEAIISQMEAGDMDLAEVFEQFTLAVEYLKQCESFLAQKRSQMDIMIETLNEEPDF